ncbi:hypothetical protein [Alteriqipengyuania lutimaris]|uniref:Uncharacterized protein n=1 Tax=Alteriqipengyuania lutimaris TaxID=1538146 RepID=A0A395LUJ3_9SPHN|nr:hypothetical protein [Alteriqipengyuania lutimaris]MBB3032793.1 hypothetical protein [Alteriqipengyuania lutimaris]RDS78110.1 hypothetical protein DL238_11190 [Alteriqipengyuania lutimaris]
MSARILQSAPYILMWLAVAIAIVSIGHAILMYQVAQEQIADGTRIEHTLLSLSVFISDLASKIGWATIPFGFAALLYRMDRKA